MALKVASPMVTPPWIVTDDTMSGANAARDVFGEACMHFICHVHLYRAWRAHGSFKGVDKQIRSQLKKYLVLMRDEKVETIFWKLFQDFRDYSKNHNAVKFCEYFTYEYVLHANGDHNTARLRQWTTWYRVSVGFPLCYGHTQTVESFHRVLKDVIMEKQICRREDRLVGHVFSHEEYQAEQYSQYLREPVNSNIKAKDHRKVKLKEAVKFYFNKTGSLLLTIRDDDCGIYSVQSKTDAKTCITLLNKRNGVFV